MKRNPPAKTRPAAHAVPVAPGLSDQGLLSRRTMMGAAALLPLLAACGTNEAPVWPRASLMTGDALSPAQRAATDRLFADTDGVGETRALLMLVDGVPVLEGYGKRFNRICGGAFAAMGVALPMTR